MKVLAVGCLIACLGCLPVWADCTAPQAPPHPPDGATTSREDMLAAMKTIREYSAAVNAFRDCAEHTQRQTDRIAADLAIDRLAGIANTYNVELNAFKKKNAQ